MGTAQAGLWQNTHVRIRGIKDSCCYEYYIREYEKRGIYLAIPYTEGYMPCTMYYL